MCGDKYIGKIDHMAKIISQLKKKKDISKMIDLIDDVNDICPHTNDVHHRKGIN